MSDADARAIIDEVRRKSGPIELHLDALATCRELPALALGVCTMRIDESAPPLRALLERAADGEFLDAAEANLLFCGVHILGAGRDSEACAPLLRLLRRPVDELDPLLGDAITETLPRIFAGTFDGDAEALFATIADASVDEFVRDALFHAATFLAWEGRIDRDAMAAFLELFFRERLAEDRDHAWYGWQQAIAMLGLRSLRPLVHQAWDEGRLSPQVSAPKYFEADLAEAERAPDDLARLQAARLGYIEDVVDALAWCDWSGDAPSGDDDDDFLADSGWTEPAVNPWRHVGRNDPCPCGSGRKYKKCCIAADVGEDPDEAGSTGPRSRTLIGDPK